jgi:hypothetical protein
MAQFLLGARLPARGNPVVVGTVEYPGNSGQLDRVTITLAGDPTGGTLELRPTPGAVFPLIYTAGERQIPGDDWGLAAASPHAGLIRKLSFALADAGTGGTLKVELPLIAEAHPPDRGAIIVIQTSPAYPSSVIDETRVPDDGCLSLKYPRNAVEGLAALQRAEEILPDELRAAVVDGGTLTSPYIVGLMDRAVSLTGFGSGWRVVLPLPSVVLVTPLPGPVAGGPSVQVGVFGASTWITWTKPAVATAVPGKFRPWAVRLPPRLPGRPWFGHPGHSLPPRRLH